METNTMGTIGEKIAEIRKRKGITQEQLAEQAKINLRTIQRIENNQTEPRGNTLKSLCAILDINIEDIVDYGKVEDRTFLVCFQLTALSFFLFPLGNVIVPLILWLTKKDKIINLREQGAGLLNVQLLWTALFFCYTIFGIVAGMNPIYFIISLLGLFGANILFIVVMAVLVSKGKLTNSYPSVIHLIK